MALLHQSRLATVPARRRDLVQARSVRGFRFTESQHEGVIPPHAHKQFTINVLLEGAFVELYGLSETACEADSVLFRPAGEVHEDRIGECGAHNFVIEMNEERAGIVSTHTNLLTEVSHVRDPRLMQLVHQMRAELVSADEASALALEGLAMSFIAHSMRALLTGYGQPRSMPWLRRSEELLRDRFREDGLRLSELAEEVGVHPVHFARAFKTHYGITPGRFLRKLRINWAAEQLRNTEQPIANVALAAGFADQSHFGRVFKQYHGISPGVYRRQFQV